MKRARSQETQQSTEKDQKDSEQCRAVATLEVHTARRVVGGHPPLVVLLAKGRIVVPIVAAAAGAVLLLELVNSYKKIYSLH